MTNQDAIVEAAAIAALRRGDLRGLEPLLQLHQVPAARIAYGITRNRSMAEDVVIDSLMKAAARIEQYDQARPFAPWFMQIVRREALRSVERSVQRRSRQADLPEIERLLELRPSPGLTPDERVELDERRRFVHEAMAKLRPKDREVLVLRYYFDLGEGEVADRLGVSLGTIKSSLSRARQRLYRLITSGPEAILEYLPEGRSSS